MVRPGGGLDVSMFMGSGVGVGEGCLGSGALEGSGDGSLVSGAGEASLSCLSFNLSMYFREEKDLLEVIDCHLFLLSLMILMLFSA